MADEIVKRCWYCDGENVDHKHGAGHSCGDCCGMHGSITEEEDAYKWVSDCLTAKNQRITALEQQLATVKAGELQQARLRLPRDPLPEDAGNWTHDELLIGYLNVAGQAQELEMSLKQAQSTLARFVSERPELGDLSLREQLRSALIVNTLQDNERLAADLTAMREDRDLWQHAHDGDCPNKVERNELMEARETIARLSGPISLDELRWGMATAPKTERMSERVNRIIAARLNPPAEDGEKGYGNVSK